MKPPRYYDKLFDNINNDHYEQIKRQRKENAEQPTETQLRAREKNTRARMQAKTSI